MSPRRGFGRRMILYLLIIATLAPSDRSSPQGPFGCLRRHEGPQAWNTAQELPLGGAPGESVARVCEIPSGVPSDCGHFLLSTGGVPLGLGVLGATYGTPSGSVLPLLASRPGREGGAGETCTRNAARLDGSIALRCIAAAGPDEGNRLLSNELRTAARRTLRRARCAHVQVFGVSCALVCVAKGASLYEDNWLWAHELRAKTRRALRRARCAHARVLTHRAYWFVARRAVVRPGARYGTARRRSARRSFGRFPVSRGAIRGRSRR